MMVVVVYWLVCSKKVEVSGDDSIHQVCDWNVGERIRYVELTDACDSVEDRLIILKLCGVKKYCETVYERE